jgi:ribosome-associated protein
MSQTSPSLLNTVVQALEEMKAKNVTTLDIGEMTSLADHMVIASGTSTRHVKALADSVQEKTREAGFTPVGVEGEQSAEWILVDLGDVIVHIMQQATREYYDLERLWRNPAHHPDRKSD